jgi:hypothetical protein
MAGERKAQERVLRRSFERHRLEEQLLSLAYQEVWPRIRNRPKANAAQSNQLRRERRHGTSELVRRA